MTENRGSLTRILMWTPDFDIQPSMWDLHWDTECAAQVYYAPHSLPELLLLLDSTWQEIATPTSPVAQPKTLKSFLICSLSLTLSTSLTANLLIDLWTLFSECILNSSTSQHILCWNPGRHHHDLFLVPVTPCIWLLCFYLSSQHRSTVIRLKHVKSR